MLAASAVLVIRGLHTIFRAISCFYFCYSQAATAIAVVRSVAGIAQAMRKITSD
jgi:hypothetical protein